MEMCAGCSGYGLFASGVLDLRCAGLRVSVIDTHCPLCDRKDQDQTGSFPHHKTDSLAHLAATVAEVEKVTVIVRNIAGDQVASVALPHGGATGIALKTAIYEQTAIPMDRQELLAGSTCLGDADTAPMEVIFVKKRSRTVLFAASHQGDLAGVKQLLAEKEQPDDAGTSSTTPLLAAAANGQINSISLNALLRPGLIRTVQTTKA